MEQVDSSIFINDLQKPLNSDYILLDEEEDDEFQTSSHTWDSEQASDRRWSSTPSPFKPTKYSIESALDDIYKYFWIRGFGRFLTSEIGQIVIWTWLVFFCIFLGTCIDYHGIRNLTTSSSIWNFIQIKAFGSGWFFVISLILYSLYFMWRVLKLFRDIVRMWKIRTFYLNILHINDFELRTIRWSEIVVRLQTISFGTLGVSSDTVSLTPNVIASLIVSKENMFKLLLERSLINFVFQVPTPGGSSTELCMLTRGLQWNLIYSIVSFFFGSDLRVRQEFHNANMIKRAELTDQLKRRITFVVCLNIFLLPFVTTFVALYAVFRYGEEFYKNPGAITTRQWSLAARWYFREFNEMPHVLDERLNRSTKHAMNYIEQFPAGAIDGIARAFAFIVGSIVISLFVISAINEKTLLFLYVTPGTTILSWITGLGAIWVFCRGVLKDRHIFSPTDALEAVLVLVKRMPEGFVRNAGTSTVLDQFKQLFSLRITQLLYEFLGVLLTPYILFFRVRPKCADIVDLFCDPNDSFVNTHANPDFDLLQSTDLINRIHQMNNNF